MIQFLSKFSNASHMRFNMFNELEVTEVKLTPVVKSYFNVDGEIYKNDEVYIKLLPGYLNLIGRIQE